MKIMIVAPYIYDRGIKEFKRNNTGFGIMIRNIAESLGKLEETVLLTRVILSRSMCGGSYRILAHKWSQFFLNIKSIDLTRAIKAFFSERTSIKNRFRYMFYELDGGYARKQIQLEKPDIVNIHGIGKITKSYIRVCEELNIKYIVTLHGLIGLNNSIVAPEYEKNIEKSFLINSSKRNIPVSVISTGMKSRIESNYLNSEADNIRVIKNGIIKVSEKMFKTLGKAKKLQKNLPKYFYDCIKVYNCYPDKDVIYRYLEYSKSANKKVLFFVGNITKNKNQIQAIEALKSSKEFGNTVLVLWGKEADGGEVRQKIIEYRLWERIILGGFNDQLELFWKFCDINLFLSLNDGFGLPIVEGYNYGVPSVAFDNLDAIEDVYYEEAMLKIEDRHIDIVANKIKEALNRGWNKKKIEDISNNFSIDVVARKYREYYKEVIS